MPMGKCGKYQSQIDEIQKLINDGKHGEAMRKSELLQKKLEADMKELNSFRGWFPELRDVPIPWLIIGVGLIFFGFFTMLI